MTTMVLSVPLLFNELHVVFFKQNCVCSKEKVWNKIEFYTSVFINTKDKCLRILCLISG